MTQRSIWIESWFLDGRARQLEAEHARARRRMLVEWKRRGPLRTAEGLT